MTDQQRQARIDYLRAQLAALVASGASVSERLKVQGMIEEARGE